MVLGEEWQEGGLYDSVTQEAFIFFLSLDASVDLIWLQLDTVAAQRCQEKDGMFS